jgi:hypothetical protein
VSRAGARLGGLLRNLLLLGLSLAFALGLGELLLRAVGYGAIYEVYSKPTAFWTHDPVLGWSHPPGAQDEYVGPSPWPIEFRAPVSINQLGLRGPELRPRPPGGARVLVLGDSVVAAFEVPYEQTFTALLETELTRRLGRDVQVLNAGVRGYGTDQSYLYYRERGRSLEPDVVLLYHSGNDPNDNAKLHEMRRPLGKPAFSLRDDGSLELVGQPVPHYPACSEYRVMRGGEVERIDRPLQRVTCRAQMLLFDRSALFSFVTMLVPWDQTALLWLYHLGAPPRQSVKARPADGAQGSYRVDLTLALLEQLDRAVEADGAKLLVTGESRRFEVLGPERLAERGVAVFPLEGLDADLQTKIRWQHDAHYNPEGHRLVAERLAAPLEALLRARGAATPRKARSD